MNVFDELRELERRGERFDTIVLDPPAFAKNKAAVAKALSGYKEINLRALKLLKPGGILVTCSCSYNVSEAMFADVLASAAVDARAEVVVVEKRMQGRDHPVLLAVPETYYLKCFMLQETVGEHVLGDRRFRDQGLRNRRCRRPIDRLGARRVSDAVYPPWDGSLCDAVPHSIGCWSRLRRTARRQAYGWRSRALRPAANAMASAGRTVHDVGDRVAGGSHRRHLRNSTEQPTSR